MKFEITFEPPVSLSVTETKDGEAIAWRTCLLKKLLVEDEFLFDCDYERGTAVIRKMR